MSDDPMTEYRCEGGPFDGRRIETSGMRVLRLPIAHPVEVVRKVIPFREPLIDVAEYERYGRVYWWTGLIRDAWASMDVSDQVIATGGPGVRSVIRGQIRRRFQSLDPDKEVGRIVWRLTRDTPTFRTTIRAYVGPRAPEYAQAIRRARRPELANP